MKENVCHHQLSDNADKNMEGLQSMGGKSASSCARKLSVQISDRREGRECTQGRARLQTLQTHPQWCTSSSKAPHPKVSITSPRSPTNKRPNS